MESGRKRVRDECDEEEGTVSKLTCVSPVKKVEGVVVEISPMKKGKLGSSFFHGKISDGTAAMRFVGYDSKVRRRLTECKGAVTMSNCEIKRGRHDGDGLEVHIRNSTEIAESKNQFDVTKEIEQQEAVTRIDQVRDMSQYQRVTVEGKVMELDGAKEVPGGMKKQDLLIADSSGSIRLTIWEVMIGQVVEGQSYRFQKMMVRMFKGKKVLSTSKTDSAIEEIDDVGEVETSDDIELEDEVGGSGGSGGRLVKGVKIVGIDRMMQYRVCMKCSGRVEEDREDGEIGECTKCKMVQCVEDCKQNISVQLTVKGSDGVPLTLRAFSKVLYDITEKKEPQIITPKMLLKARGFNLRHLNGLVQSITRDIDCITS